MNFTTFAILNFTNFFFVRILCLNLNFFSSAIVCSCLDFGLPPRDGLAECDQPGKNPLKYSTMELNPGHREDRQWANPLSYQPELWKWKQSTYFFCWNSRVQPYFSKGYIVLMVPGYIVSHYLSLTEHRVSPYGLTPSLSHNILTVTHWTRLESRVS